MEEKRKIIICLTGYLPTDQRMTRIGTALHEMNFNVTVFYRHYFKYQAKSLNTTAFPFQIQPLQFAINSGIIFYFLFNFKVFFKLLFEPADCFYAVDSDTLPALTLLSIIRRKQLVYDAHEYFAEVPELDQKPFKKWIWHKITAWGVRNADICFTVANQLSVELSKVYKKKFECIRNVPFYQAPVASDKLDPPCIIYQGALNKGRQLEMLIDAMHELPQYQCIIIGEGDLSESLRERAKSYKNIEFKGLMSPNDIKSITPKCAWGFNLLDSKGSLSYHYSLSNKYFDYMLAAVPSISSELPEYQELNDKFKCGVCLPDDKKALIDFLNACAPESFDYKNLKENAIIAAKVNNWEIEKQQLFKLFKP
jgi:glycosyltransferase involved in cell wall biosynthesis